MFTIIVITTTASMMWGRGDLYKSSRVRVRERRRWDLQRELSRIRFRDKEA
jgi:hypothetical protein